MNPVQEPKTKSRWREVMGVAALVVLVQGILVQFTPIVWLQPDWAEYVALARHLVEHGNIGFGDDWRQVPVLAVSFQAFAYEADYAAFRPPGFPVLLAVLGLADGLELRVRWVLIGANAVAAGFLWDLTKQWRGYAAAVAATALWTVSPGGLASLRSVAREPLLAPVAMATLWLVLRALEAETARRPVYLAAAAGVLTGLGALVKETALLVVAAAAFWLVLGAWYNRSKRHLLIASVLVASATVTIAPWCIRNSLVQGRPAGLTTMGSVATVLALVDQNWPVPAPDPTLPAGSVQASLDQAQRRTATFVRQRPVAAARNFMNNVKWYWSPWPRFSAAGDWKAPVIALYYGLVFAAAAWTAARERHEPLVQIAVIALLVLGLAHGVSLAAPRYRAPFEGLIYLLAVASLPQWLAWVGRVVSRQRGTVASLLQR